MVAAIVVEVDAYTVQHPNWKGELLVNDVNIGIKAVVLNHAVIGRDCLIGANSLVAEGKVIPDRSLVVGSPGRVVRQLTDAEVAMVRGIAQHYVDNAARYRASLNAITEIAEI